MAALPLEMLFGNGFSLQQRQEEWESCTCGYLMAGQIYLKIYLLRSKSKNKVHLDPVSP